MDNLNNQQQVLDMTRVMNYKKHAKQLFIPVLNDFKLKMTNF